MPEAKMQDNVPLPLIIALIDMMGASKGYTFALISIVDDSKTPEEFLRIAKGVDKPNSFSCTEVLKWLRAEFNQNVVEIDKVLNKHNPTRN